MKGSGVADLPTHGGRVPQGLAERMTKLGTAITETIVHDYGAPAFLSRLSDPFWFPRLRDWSLHSSFLLDNKVVLGNAWSRGLNQ